MDKPKKTHVPKLEFNGKDLSIIFRALQKLPFEEVADLIQRMAKYKQEVEKLNK